MKRKILSVLTAVICITFLSSVAFAWTANVKKLFENDEYQKVIDLTEKSKKDSFARMFLAFSHLQESVFNKTKYDKEKFKGYMMWLEAKCGIDDIDNILYFINLKDKPYVVKEARKLAKKTFKNISKMNDIPKLIKFLKSSDEDSRKLALSTMTRILKPKRKYVNEGGTMRPNDIRVMGSQNLIKSLLENIQEKQAQKALQIIEEPVLQYTGQYAGNETAKLEVKINKTIAKRKKKYPDSNWYSATGKKRQ